MVDVKVRGARKFQAKMQDIKLSVENELTAEVVEFGYNYAMRVMPDYSGALKRAFEKKVYRKTGSLTQFQPAQGRRNPRPYHLWLNGTGNRTYLRSDGEARQINLNTFLVNRKTGKPFYLRLTRDAMIRKIKSLKLV